MSTLNPTPFEKVAREVFVDVFTAGRLAGKSAVSAKDWMRERDMSVERLSAAVLQMVKAELDLIRHISIELGEPVGVVLARRLESIDKQLTGGGDR